MWQSREGRAGATVRMERDTLVVEATCDSVWRMVELYEEELWRMRQASDRSRAEVQTEERSRVHGWRGALVAFVAGVAAGAALRGLVKREK